MHRGLLNRITKVGERFTRSRGFRLPLTGGDKPRPYGWRRGAERIHDREDRFFKLVPREPSGLKWSQFLLTLALGVSFATPASAHHILGIPHYKYGEEYPQIPYVEVVAEVGTRQLVFTYFPGTPKPGDRVRFKLYVRDEVTGEPFRDPLTATFVQRKFFGADEVIAGPLTLKVGVGPEGNDYKFFHTFEAAEAYELHIDFPNGDTHELIPFPISIGVTDDRPLFFGAAGVLVVAVITVALLKRRKKAEADAKRSVTHEEAA